jgi:hypothetical protein
MEINSRKNTTEVLMEKKLLEMKGGMRGRLDHEQDQVARPTGGTAPPRSVWASVAGSASPLTCAPIYWKKTLSPKGRDFTRSGAPQAS